MSRWVDYGKNIYTFFSAKGWKTGGICYKNIGVLDAAGLLIDKNIIVTGGSSGIGYSIAKACRKQGANVLLIGRDLSKLQKVGRELDAHFLSFDICNTSEIKDCVKQIIEIFDGRIDCLVNNAGILGQFAFPEVTEDEWDNVMATCLKGAFFFTQQLFPLFREQKNGNILNISSNGTFSGQTIPYNIAKTGLNHFTAGLAKEGARYGVRCNAIAPGYTISNIAESFSLNPNGNLYRKDNRGNAWHIPEEISNVAVFLLSDLSKCINGQIIGCDSGASL